MYAAYFAVLGVVLPFLGPWLEGRGVGALGIGLGTAAFSLAKLGYTPWLARRVDRRGGGWGLLVAHALLAVAATALLPVASSTNAIILCLLVLGAGYGTVLPLVEAAVLERLPSGGYGRLRLWGSVGFVVVAVVLPLSGTDLEGRGFPLALGAVLVVLTVACVPFEAHARVAPATTRSARLGPRARALLTLLTLHQVSHGPYYAFLSVRLAAAGYGPFAIGVLWSAGVVAEMVTFRWGDRLERWLGLEGLLTVALVATPLRWILLALPPVWPLLVVAQTGHAASFAAAHLSGVQLVDRIVPPAARRQAQAWYAGLCFGLGIVAGSAAAGPVWQRLDAATFGVAAGLSLVVLGAWIWWVRPALRR